ncbi:MAG: hypothetical protein QOF13_2456 [Solirubrobacterales bacterium]|jgi:predicted regulator of amino acid metabolism with ACT domain|nr:hypothetical protein [Solirubrobacterales bacterium]
MYILTNQLVALPDSALPLPWYHRAPLGLTSGIPVYVALQARQKRPFGDLLISVVDPAKWPFVSEISASKQDEPGVLADVYSQVPPLNIVIAEAVTVDSGSRHDARLVLEPFHLDQDEDEVKKMVDEETGRLKEKLEEMGFEPPDDRQIHENDNEWTWVSVGRIEHGWLHVEGWRKAVEDQEIETTEAHLHDLSMAVISADTDRRILRYVFPRKGAVTVSIKHADRPGTMGVVANALASNKLNILSSLLRRGPTSPAQAEIVVVVEPTDESAATEEVETRVEDALNGLPPMLMVTPKISGPIDPDSVLYPRRPDEIAVRPSKELGAAIRSVKKDLPAGKWPIFISRRFVDSTSHYNDEVVKELENVLEDNDFIAVEALPEAGADRTVPDAVKAKMWASKAAIVLVVSMPGDDELSAFSANLAHEWGFMQGQGKPLMPLVEKNLSSSITDNANLQGLQLTTFDKDHAMSSRHPESIYQKAGAWLKLLREARTDP